MGQPNPSGDAKKGTALVVAAGALVAASGCGVLGPAGSPGQVLDSISVSSPRLSEDAPLPAAYSCRGNLGNPPLRWSGVPADRTKSLAIVVDDNSLEGAEVHWVLFNIDPRTTEIGENISDNLPEGARQGRTSSGKVGYSPPCRESDNYRFTVYALNGKLNRPEGAPLSETLPDIADKTIARGRLTTVRIE